MIIFLSSLSFALSMLDVTNGVLGRSPFQISGTQDILEQEFDEHFDSRDISEVELDLRLYQYSAVQNSMNSGDWSNAADMWRIFLQKSAVNNAWFLENEKSLFLQMQQVQTSQDLESLLHNYSLQTWYIICLTRANKHFEAQYQLNKWATNLGLYSSEEKEPNFLNRKQEKDIQSWIDMQVNIEKQISASDVEGVDVQLDKEEQEAVIWLLSEYRILRSWVEGEQGKDRSSLQHARQASKILEGYAVFQREQDNLHLDNKSVLQKIQNTEKSTDSSVHLEQKNLKIERDDRVLFYEGSLFAVDILEMRSWMSLKRHKRADGVLERRKNMSLKDLDDAWLWYEVGVESLWKGDQEEGLIYLERAINSKYSSPLHVQVLFMQLIEKQNFALALRFAIDGIQRFPNSNLLSILLREMDNPGLHDYWKQSSLQPERKWVRAIWGVYVSESLVEKDLFMAREGETHAIKKEEILEKKREHVFDLLRTSFLFPETSDVVIEKYFALCKQMKRQNVFIKDMIALHKKGYIFQHEHQRILLEVLSSDTLDLLTGLGEELHLDFMKLQLVLYQDIFNKRHKNTTGSNLKIHEHRIGMEIAKNFVYFYRNDSLSASLFWTRELLYWKGWHSGDLLKMWCPYFDKEENKSRRELFFSKISGTDKPYCPPNYPYENTLRDVEIQDLNWFCIMPIFGMIFYILNSSTGP